MLCQQETLYSNRLASESAVESVLEQFSPERVQYVLAGTIQQMDHDGRIHQSLKDWAKEVEICPDSSECCIVGKAHSGLISLVASDTTKTKSSMRTLPLVPFVKEQLLALRKEQKENRRLCGRSYNKEYLDYVCVNEIGDLIKPHYVTESFPKLLKANGFRPIRFHDLRHSCASLLLANGVSMKQIQEWLGHSDFSTTANIYAHLDYSSKLTSADAMLSGLGISSPQCSPHNG